MKWQFVLKQWSRFLSKSRGLQSDTKNQKSLGSLANMEDQHKRIFTEMRTTLTEKDKSPKIFVTPMTKYLSTLLQWRTTWAEKEAPLLLKSLTEKETLEEIPQTAVGLEKVSILFYPGIKDLIPSRSGQDRIDDIIKEERRHVIQLSNLLEKLKTN